MALLPDLDRERVWRWLLRRLLGPCDFIKPELRDAVNAIDAWLDANASTINQAFPAQFRTKATAGQKALVLAAVVMRRYGSTLLKVEEEG